jgi:hypothetical protein
MTNSLIRAFAFLLCALPFTQAYAEEPFYMLKINSVICLDERDAIAIADAQNSPDATAVIWQRIAMGECLIPNPLTWPVTAVAEKRTPAGQTYYCFNRLLMEQLGEYPDLTYREYAYEKRECVSSDFMTTVDEDLKARTGRYKIISEYTYSIKASCIEGGTVQLQKTDQGYLRTSISMPWKYPPYFVLDVPTGPDIDAAITDGCKGADVR